MKQLVVNNKASVNLNKRFDGTMFRLEPEPWRTPNVKELMP